MRVSCGKRFMNVLIVSIYIDRWVFTEQMYRQSQLISTCRRDHEAPCLRWCSLVQRSQMETCKERRRRVTVIKLMDTDFVVVLRSLSHTWYAMRDYCESETNDLQPDNLTKFDRAITRRDRVKEISFLFEEIDYFGDAQMTSRASAHWSFKITLIRLWRRRRIAEELLDSLTKTKGVFSIIRRLRVLLNKRLHSIDINAFLLDPMLYGSRLFGHLIIFFSTACNQHVVPRQQILQLITLTCLFFQTTCLHTIMTLEMTCCHHR